MESGSNKLTQRDFIETYNEEIARNRKTQTESMLTIERQPILQPLVFA